MVALRPDFAALPLERLGTAFDGSGPPVVLCSDEGYAFQMQVALTSIFLNSSRRALDVVVFADRWRETLVEQLDKLARRFGRSITLVRVSQQMLPPAFTAPTFPRAAFFKLVSPEIIDGDRLLFLDCDIVAQIDLDEVWQNYRDDMLVGGVPDFHARDWLRRFGSAEPDTYVNSGVLVINSMRWREERAVERCAAWLQANPNLAWLADQDPLNKALGGIYYLPGHWNVVTMNRPPGWRLDVDAFRGIYHFAGRVKPWMRCAEPVLQELYLQYARIVGLPADYWVEARNAGEALMEAQWAEEQGNLAKAKDIYKRVARAALAKLRELSPGTVVGIDER
jgi:lipopolysaccharide biosynthesis glycosyltransferase